MRQRTTLPFDIVLGLRLLHSAGTISALADELSVAPSQVHASLRRLEFAGLLRGDGRSVNARAFGEFVLFGVRYAFPAHRSDLATGVPTAYSASALSALVDATDVIVWPASGARDAVRGFALQPLYRGAIQLPLRSPETYRLLTLVDALRIGDAKTRNLAREQLEVAFGWRASSTGDASA